MDRNVIVWARTFDTKFSATELFWKKIHFSFARGVIIFKRFILQKKIVYHNFLQAPLAYLIQNQANRVFDSLKMLTKNNIDVAAT